MLWYKSWLETRSRFAIGLVLLILSVVGIVMAHSSVMQLIPAADTLPASGALGRRIRENADLVMQYRGYVWSQWTRQTFLQVGTLFAVLLGSGGLLANPSGASAIFTFSMPVSRNRILGARAAVGLAELLTLAIVPSLLIPVISLVIGEHYAVTEALVHAVCFFVAAAAFFSLALLLSTVFSDIWRPLLITCGAAMALSLYEQAAHGQSTYGIFSVMTGESYFRTGHLPWLGLAASAIVSAAILLTATRSLAQQDF